jgi:hypothetical protein
VQNKKTLFLKITVRKNIKISYLSISLSSRKIEYMAFDEK